MARRTNLKPAVQHDTDELLGAAPVSTEAPKTTAVAKVSRAIELAPSADHRPAARMGYLIILATFGLFGGWAAFAPLSSAVIAPGTVMFESNRKTIQHLEGGIVRKIHVKEGTHVEAGDVLFDLDSTQAGAGFTMARNQLLAYTLQEARLKAERDGAATFTPPVEIQALAATDAEVARTIADETKSFADRKAALRSQLAVYQSRHNQLSSELSGLVREHESLTAQMGYIDDELEGLRKVYDQGLVAKPKLLEFERARASMEGNLGRLSADQAKTEEGMAEVNLQIRQIREGYLQEVSTQILEVSTKKAELEQREVVAEDQMKRMRVVAPVAGTVQNIKVFTEGAVIRGGEPMAEVVPSNDTMDIQAQISPAEVDNIHVDMKAEVRLSSFPSRTTPPVEGIVQSISRDRLIDEATRQPYFLAVVKMDPDKLPEHVRTRLTGGLPAEVIIQTGQRTMLQYLFEPLERSVRRSMREE